MPSTCPSLADNAGKTDCKTLTGLKQPMDYFEPLRFFCWSRFF